ncbi:uracil-xanthine permease family protein [Aidingimonas halophila]|uniref:Nucleobase:cation symporter-2, NCS2 family n=1 Tax=Aidingimonas halophila TaxID=574349 RepID=A0A1H3A525_9GAMM|nr:nucleobase:cation symporter-2 family protein [Aidingimonas halophila]GHC21582.1 xanthine/uracil permease [Aidingimonas halophila]SDX24713.1 nucleobase:cation symporter-2, NCS2 family [Aidingimonas halophila]
MPTESTSSDAMATPNDNPIRSTHDVNARPPLGRAIPLGLQHVLAMFVSNVTVPIIIAGAADLSDAQTTLMIQAAMFVAGVATLVQSLGLGPIGARLPIVMGTSFGFVPVLIPIAVGMGVPAALGAALCGGVAMALVGLFLPWLRFLFPPVVTGTFVIMIGTLLMPVGFAYAGGGFGADDFGSPHHLLLAALVLVVTVGMHQFGRGIWSEISPLAGLVTGFIAAVAFGYVDFSSVGDADWFSLPTPFAIGVEFHLAAIVPVVLLAVVTCAESIGDIVGTTVGGANREPTQKELSGGVMADGLASVFAAIFNAYPQISFSQNVGIVALTGVISRFVVAIGGGFLVIAGLLPKLGGLVSSIPNSVLGGAVLIMFGMIASAGIKMLSGIDFNKRNMLIIALSLAAAIGLPAQEGLYENLSDNVQGIIESGLIPGALVAIILNLILPRSEQPMRDDV